MNDKPKELAKWIYYEDGDIFYCSNCIEKRLEEIDTNEEFSEYIDYKSSEKCGYHEDYADVGYEVQCCKCEHPLFSKIDC